MKGMEELTSTARQSMRDVGLSEDYVKSIGHTWNVFGRWLKENNMEYSPGAGKRFLEEECSVGGENANRLSPSAKRKRRAIAILKNCYEYKPYFRVEDRRYESTFNERFEQAFVSFLDSIVEVLADSTICGYVYTLNRLSSYLVRKGVNDVSDIGTSAIVGFLEDTATSGVDQQTIYATSGKLRRITTWFGQNGFIDPAIAEQVPQAKPPQKQLPDVYSDEEIELMIKAIDTASPIGKRDLVACLLAARLGMRAADITDLSLDNLNWKDNTIEFFTLKTGKKAVLPLTNEIGEAIIAYIKHGRPTPTESMHVLLRHEKPYVKMRPAFVHHIVSKALNRAGIAIDGRRHGPHALRASVATRMMRENTPMPVISETLSHANSDTTRLYLKVDVDKLRECALDVDPLVNTWWKTGGLR